jgi:hypothetical protein
MEEPKAADLFAREHERAPHDHKMPGTIVLVLVLLLAFIVYYFANWKALADVWHVR